MSLLKTKKQKKQKSKKKNYAQCLEAKYFLEMMIMQL